MGERMQSQRKGISNCHTSAHDRRTVPRAPKINMSAGSYLRGRTILFLAFERIRAIICILLEASGSTSMRVIARSASPLGPSAPHDHFAFAAQKGREGEREDGKSRRRERDGRVKRHDWKNSERVVNSEKTR